MWKSLYTAVALTMVYGSLAPTGPSPLSAGSLQTTDLQFVAKVGGCLDANTGVFGSFTYMRPCTDPTNPNLRWDIVPMSNGVHLISRTTGFCLDANTGIFGAGTYMRPCDDGSNPNLVWHFYHFGNWQGFHIRSRTTEACLDANTGQLGNFTYMRPCDNGENPNLRWGTAYPDAS